MGNPDQSHLVIRAPSFLIPLEFPANLAIL